MSDDNKTIPFVSQRKPPPNGRELNWRPCPTCDGKMRFTGLPDVSGPIYYRIYKCSKCGYKREDVSAEASDGWG